MHYSGHHLTASVTTRTYASANDQWIRPACPLVSVSSVQLHHSLNAFSLTGLLLTCVH